LLEVVVVRRGDDLHDLHGRCERGWFGPIPLQAAHGVLLLNHHQCEDDLEDVVAKVLFEVEGATAADELLLIDALREAEVPRTEWCARRPRRRERPLSTCLCLSLRFHRKPDARCLK
jgi:hypothetical protein